MRRTTPDLVGRRKRIYNAISAGLLVLTVAYVVWINYVAFVGGNLPLTPIHLGDGSTGAGLVMLPLGDLIVILAIWFILDGVVLNVVHMVLRDHHRPGRVGRGPRTVRRAASTRTPAAGRTTPAAVPPPNPSSSPAAGDTTTADSPSSGLRRR